MPTDRSRASLATLACAAAAICPAGASRAGVSYTTPGVQITQDFNSLPIAPEQTSLQGTVPWADDANSTSSQTGIVGWYLYHPTSQAEGGANGHQRFRIASNAAGGGVPDAGSFYSFGSSSTDSNRALGDVGDNTLAADGGTLWVAVRITNDTGQTLTSARIGYTGEEWRNGGLTSAGEHLVVGYSTSATAINSPDTAFAVIVPLTFVPPVASGTAGSLDGHAAANRHVLAPVTITGLNWAPGTDLWVRWSDPQVAGAEDFGLAIDDFSFSATGVPEPASLGLLAAAAGMPLAGRRRRVRTCNGGGAGGDRPADERLRCATSQIA